MKFWHVFAFLFWAPVVVGLIWFVAYMASGTVAAYTH